ncbi:MAG: nitrous oxide-stimulated promoter family protein [Campylobacterales bacterium]|nr:nitrous oxide-stimulated promoter family protein [Campylobacterales bacterium]
MTEEKFQSEIKILEVFFTHYCRDKHQFQYIKNYHLEYKKSAYTYELNLCKECHELISYSYARLKNCSHSVKPRCRECDDPCYEKEQWKRVAKVMRYNGIRVGTEKILNKLYGLLFQEKTL